MIDRPLLPLVASSEDSDDSMGRSTAARAYWRSIERAGLGGSDDSEEVSLEEVDSSDSSKEWSSSDGDGDEDDGSSDGDGGGERDGDGKGNNDGDGEGSKGDGDGEGDDNDSKGDDGKGDGSGDKANGIMVLV
jgi:hypothetical protein